MSVSREQVQPYISNQYTDEQIRELIERHVDSDSLGYGIAKARIRGTGTTVAMVIDDLEAEHGDIQKTAWDFHLSVEQVVAAVFFYWQHQEIIDAQITVQRSYFMD